MPIIWLTFVGQAALTAGITLTGQILIVRYQHRQTLARDRIQQQYAKEQARWQRLEPRVTALKDMAGRILYCINGAGISGKNDEVEPLLRDLDAMGGQFAEYPTVLQALDAFEQSAGRFCQLWSNPLLFQAGTGLTEDWKRYKEHFVPANHRALVAAVNALLESERPAALPSRSVSLRAWLSRLR